MQKARLKGVELEYQVAGSGDPMLLIPTGPIAGCFQPLFRQEVLVDHFTLITYHQRGQGGSTRSERPTFADHAADAAGLLEHLGFERAHVTGHSSGGTTALQLAHDYPERVHTLVLLEPALMTVPSAPAFFSSIGAAIDLYSSGDRERAMIHFLTVVCSLDWDMLTDIIEQRIPGGVSQVMEDADTFFESFLPALGSWQFGVTEAARISQPMLSVLGTNSHQLFVEGRTQLHSWFPQIVDATIENAAHLLQMEQPAAVAKGIADFLGRYPLSENHFGGSRTEASSNATISL